MNRIVSSLKDSGCQVIGVGVVAITPSGRVVVIGADGRPVATLPRRNATIRGMLPPRKQQVLDAAIAIEGEYGYVLASLIVARDDELGCLSSNYLRWVLSDLARRGYLEKLPGRYGYKVS